MPRNHTVLRIEESVRPADPLLEVLEPRLLLATIVVNTLADPAKWASNDAEVSLREALATAAANAGDDVIQFAPALFAAGPAKITLVGNGRDLAITSNVIIKGPGADKLTIDGDKTHGRAGHVFTIGTDSTQVSVQINDLTIANGHASGNSFYAEHGGGILNFGALGLNRVVVSSCQADNGGGGLCSMGFVGTKPTLTLANCTFTGNEAVAYGGGIYQFRTTATVTNCTFDQNKSDYWSGGAIANSNDATISIAACTFKGNSAANGGAINNYGSLALESSTFFGNKANSGSGGALSNNAKGPASVTNSTFWNNSAHDSTKDGSGGAIDSYGGIWVANCTLSGNAADLGGGMANAPFTGADFMFANNIVAGNVDAAKKPSDLHGDFGSTYYKTYTCAHNLVGVVDGSQNFPVGVASGNLSGTLAAPLNPRLGALADNGGPTQTMALLAASRAIDAGDSALAKKSVRFALTTDQRGLTRVRGAAVDIGAYELQTPYPNQRPVAVAGGPYTVNEGSTRKLDASASYDPEGGPLKYAWDFDSDGLYDDASGANATFSALKRNGPATVKVGLLVTDIKGATGRTTATISIVNVAPTVTMSTAMHIVDKCQSVGVTAQFSDPGTSELYKATIDWGDGNSSSGTINMSGLTITGQHQYLKSGTFNVTVTLTDGDGGSGSSHTRVLVLTTQLAIDDLITRVKGMKLSDAVTQSLGQKLQTVKARLLDKSSDKIILSALQAFVNNVDYWNGKRLLANVQHDTLLQYAGWIQKDITMALPGRLG
jgi:hypothetical protein